MRFLLPALALGVPLHLKTKSTSGSAAVPVAQMAEDYYSRCVFPQHLQTLAEAGEEKKYHVGAWNFSAIPWDIKETSAGDHTGICPSTLPKSVEVEVEKIKKEVTKKKGELLSFFQAPSEEVQKEFFANEGHTPPTEESGFEELPRSILWPDRIVPYTFNSVGVTWSDKIFIWSAMLILRSVTNIGFVQVEANKAGHRIRINHGTAGPAAAAGFSVVGHHTHAANEIAHTVGAATHQDLDGGIPAAGSIFTAVHELIHAIGFGHMNQRNDRATCLNMTVYGNYVNRGVAGWAAEPVNCAIGGAGWYPAGVDAGHFGYQSVMMYPPWCCCPNGGGVNCITPVDLPLPAACTHHHHGGGAPVIAFDRLYAADIEAIDAVYGDAAGVGHAATYCRWWCA